MLTWSLGQASTAILDENFSADLQREQLSVVDIRLLLLRVKTVTVCELLKPPHRLHSFVAYLSSYDMKRKASVRFRLYTTSAGDFPESLSWVLRWDMIVSMYASVFKWLVGVQLSRSSLFADFTATSALPLDCG